MNIFHIPQRRLRPGERGTALVTGVNCKTTQTIIVPAVYWNLRYLITAIRFISQSVSSVSNGATLSVKEITDTPTAATLSTAMTGSNNDIDFTAVTGGTAGNDITITLVDPSGNDAELEVVVTGTDIVVNLATDGSGTITSTAAQVRTAIAADTDAAALVSTANKSGNDGTGVVTALAETNLAGGLPYTIGFTHVASGSLASSDKEGLVQNLTLAASPEVVEGGSSLLFSITTGSTATTDTKDILIEYTAL